MLDKGRIIKSAFLKLGKNNAYNDNKSDEYIVASSLLDNILDNIAKRTSFLFNAVTVKLTATGKNDLKENRFNLPVDYLNIIRANKTYRIEGEFLYSPEKEIFIQYCRKINISEYPDNLFDYLVASLCMEMAMAFNGYEDRYPVYSQVEYEERNKIINQQGFQYNPWGDL